MKPKAYEALAKFVRVLPLAKGACETSAKEDEYNKADFEAHMFAQRECGWDWESDEQFMEWALHSTPDEIAPEQLRRFVRFAFAGEDEDLVKVLTACSLLGVRAEIEHVCVVAYLPERTMAIGFANGQLGWNEIKADGSQPEVAGEADGVDETDEVDVMAAVLAEVLR